MPGFAATAGLPCSFPRRPRQGVSEGIDIREISEAIEIDAPAAEVWAVLTDFPRYADWNPFMVDAAGTPALGERLTVRLVPPGRRGITMKPTVTALKPGRSFRWLGHLLVPGLFDGEHIHELEAGEGHGTRYVQREVFRGVLVPFVRRMLDDTAGGFRAMNEALKARVEHH